MTLGPRNDAEKEVFAVEGFRVDVQYLIQKLMNDRGVSHTELARKLSISDAEVHEIFSDECNLNIRMLARIFHALDDECVISSRRLEEQKNEKLLILDKVSWDKVIESLEDHPQPTPALCELFKDKL